MIKHKYYNIINSILLISFITTSSCTNPPVVPSESKKYDFELLIPKIFTSEDYLAISGIKISQQEIKVGDSLQEDNRISYYAQATHSDTVKQFTKVTINDIELKKHANTDTLRIAPTNDLSLYQANKWDFIIDDDKAEIAMNAVDALDTIIPFVGNKYARSDKEIILKWKPVLSNNYEIFIQAKTNQYKFTISVPDRAGEAIIPLDQIKKLYGKCLISIVRYQHSVRIVKEKNIHVLRVSQRDLDVIIQ